MFLFVDTLLNLCCRLSTTTPARSCLLPEQSARRISSAGPCSLGGLRSAASAPRWGPLSTVNSPTQATEMWKQALHRPRGHARRPHSGSAGARSPLPSRGPAWVQDARSAGHCLPVTKPAGPQTQNGQQGGRTGNKPQLHRQHVDGDFVVGGNRRAFPSREVTGVWEGRSVGAYRHKVSPAQVGPTGVGRVPSAWASGPAVSPRCCGC